MTSRVQSIAWRNVLTPSVECLPRGEGEEGPAGSGSDDVQGRLQVANQTGRIRVRRVGGVLLLRCSSHGGPPCGRSAARVESDQPPGLARRRDADLGCVPAWDPYLGHGSRCRIAVADFRHRFPPRAREEDSLGPNRGRCCRGDHTILRIRDPSQPTHLGSLFLG